MYDTEGSLAKAERLIADAVRAAVDTARGQGASTVVVAAGGLQSPVPGAAERIIDDMDVLAFCGRMLEALGVR